MQSTIIKISLVLLAAAITVSCLKEDEGPLLPEEDGLYIKGAATAFDYFAREGMMKPAVNEADGQVREGLYEIFIAVTGEQAGFNIVEVRNGRQTVYGPASSEEFNPGGEDGQVNCTILRGATGSDAGVFTVPSDGLYHVALEMQTGTWMIVPVESLSLYFHPGVQEWSDIVIPPAGGFDKSSISFELDGLELNEGEFRIRYGGGDRIRIGQGNNAIGTSFGGSISGSQPSFELTMGREMGNYITGSDLAGIYNLSVSWSAGEGFSARLNETGSHDYPADLFIIGSGISKFSGDDAWDWSLNDFRMIPVHGRPQIFWKIVWLNRDGGIRISPQKDWGGDFGREGNAEAGVYSIGEQDIPVPGTEGFYMVAVNFGTGQVSVSKPSLYLIGDVVRSWDLRNPDYLFTVDNSFRMIRLFTKFLYEGRLRIYAWHEHGWFQTWTNAEINISSDGKIMYKGNMPVLDNIHRVSKDGVYTIILDFETDEGSIEYCECSP